MADLKSDIWAELAERRPELMQAINHLRNSGSDLITTHWAFLDDPEILAEALAYAYDQGVAVIFAPDSRKAKGP